MCRPNAGICLVWLLAGVVVASGCQWAAEVLAAVAVPRCAALTSVTVAPRHDVVAFISLKTKAAAATATGDI